MDAIEIIQDVLCLTLFGTEILAMADDLSHLLFSFASYSNFYAVIIILVCFVATAVLILRFNNDLLVHFPMLGPLPQNMAAKQTMTGYTNPISVMMKDKISASLKDGFSLDVSSLSEGKLSVIWGPNINILHEVLQWPADKILDYIGDGLLLKSDEDSLIVEKSQRLSVEGNREYHFECPSCVNETTLGPSPRRRYPCVAVASVTENNGADTVQVVASFTLLHLRDSFVSQESHIIAQYLKLSDDRVFNLQPVYLATENDTNSQTDSLPGTQSPPIENTETMKSSTSNLLSNTNSVQASNKPHVESSAKLQPETINFENTSLKNSEDTSVSNPEKNSSDVSSTVIRNDVSDLTQSPICERFDTSHNLSSEQGERNGTVNENTRTLACDPHNMSPQVCKDGAIETCPRSISNSGSNDSSIASAVSEEHGYHSLTPDVENTEGADVSPNDPECVVCQVNPISHVILPCRHACICSFCFKKVDRCPMCRGYIETYFTLFDEPNCYIEDNESEEMPNQQTGVVAWVMNLNDRLNEYLGFT